MTGLYVYIHIHVYTFLCYWSIPIANMHRLCAFGRYSEEFDQSYQGTVKG